VDFHAGVIRPYNNWVLNQDDDTKTSEFAPIPMTPRFTDALARLKQRDPELSDQGYVFALDRTSRPVSGKDMRKAFKLAALAAGLAPIPMYNLRHSFGTRLASRGVDVRTIQALMRHDRLSTTEQYLAYAPQPDLADQLARALEPSALPKASSSRAPYPETLSPSFLQRLEEEIPAKWLREILRLHEEESGQLAE
jgi:integrase